MAILIMSDAVLNKLTEAIKASAQAITNQNVAIALNTQALATQTQSLLLLTSVLQKIEDDLNPKPVKIQLKFDDKEPGMPIQLTDSGAGSSAIATPAETDAAGNPVTVDPTAITYGVSDPSAFTLTPNNTNSDMPGTDGAGNPVTIPAGGCQFKAIGTAGHLGAFQATVQDSKNNLSGQDTVTVVSGAATSLSIGFSPAS